MSVDPAIAVRPLQREDGSSFRDLRLRALREDPIPFLASYEEEARWSVKDVAGRLAARAPGTEVLGAFRDAVLVGTLGFYRHAQAKARHRVSMWGMYVAAGERRRGIGRALLDEAIARLKSIGDVAQIELTVVQAAEPARRLYLGRGFEVQGVFYRAMKDGARYFDEDTLILRLDGSPSP